MQNVKFEPEGMGGALLLSQIGVDQIRTGWVDEQRDAVGRGDHFMQQFEPFRPSRSIRLPRSRCHLVDASWRQVPVRPGPVLCRRRSGSWWSLPWPPMLRAYWRAQQSQPPDYEPDRPPAPAVDRPDPLPSDIQSSRSGLHITGFMQALVEGGQTERVGLARASADVSNHRHRLLR